MRSQVGTQSTSRMKPHGEVEGERSHDEDLVGGPGGATDRDGGDGGGHSGWRNKTMQH